jgi:excisionase family DNA binding protein
MTDLVNEAEGGVPPLQVASLTDSPVLLTVEEAADRLRIGRTSMYRLVTSGAIETVTVGRLRRVPAECITEYVNRLRSHTRTNLPAA